MKRYRLLKDLPGFRAGETIHSDSTEGRYTAITISIDADNQKDWFEEVKEEKPVAWCKHIEEKIGSADIGDEWKYCNNHFLNTTGWKVCPICSAPRPTEEKKEEGKNCEHKWIWVNSNLNYDSFKCGKCQNIKNVSKAAERPLPDPEELAKRIFKCFYYPYVPDFESYKVQWMKISNDAIAWFKERGER